MFTDITTIKKITQANFIPITNIANERLVLSLFNSSQLQHSNITPDSETVKIIRHNTPVADSGNPITLNTTAQTSLTWQKIVWDSVVVANDLLLSTVYTENDDYIIDYFNGTISRASVGSSISDGGTVYVWYLPFTSLTAGSDYNINYDFGTITRRGGTTIPDRATVFVDYAHSQATITDEAIQECIDQAEQFITERLKSQYSAESPEIGIKSAATNFTMYLLSLSQTFKILNVERSDEASDIAKQWQVLADKYMAAAWSMFAKYLKISSQDYAGIIQNRFTTKRHRSVTSPSLNSAERRF